MFDSWFLSAPSEIRVKLNPLIEESVSRMVTVMNDRTMSAADRSFELLCCAAQLRSIKVLADALSRSIRAAETGGRPSSSG